MFVTLCHPSTSTTPPSSLHQTCTTVITTTFFLLTLPRAPLKPPCKRLPCTSSVPLTCHTITRPLSRLLHVPSLPLRSRIWRPPTVLPWSSTIRSQAPHHGYVQVSRPSFTRITSTTSYLAPMSLPLSKHPKHHQNRTFNHHCLHC